MPFTRDSLVSTQGSRGLLSLFVGLAAGAFLFRADPLAATTAGLALAAALYGLFALGERAAVDPEVDTSASTRSLQDLGSVFALAAAGALVALAFFGALTLGFPTSHPQFWPGAALIVGLVVAVGVALDLQGSSF